MFLAAVQTELHFSLLATDVLFMGYSDFGIMGHVDFGIMGHGDIGQLTQNDPNFTCLT